jgi:hypothetical protein
VQPVEEDAGIDLARVARGGFRQLVEIQLRLGFEDAGVRDRGALLPAREQRAGVVGRQLGQRDDW